MPQINSALTSTWTFKDVTIHYRKLLDLFEMYEYPELLGTIQMSTGKDQEQLEAEIAANPAAFNHSHASRILEFARSRIVQIDGIEDTSPKSRDGQLDWAALTVDERRHSAGQLMSCEGYESVWNDFQALIMKSYAVTQEEVGE